MPERVDLDVEEGVARTRRTIGKSGNSLVVRIPPQILQAASLQEGDDVELVADMESGTITIKRASNQQVES